MKLSRILAAMMLMAGPSATIFAREAELLDFLTDAAPGSSAAAHPDLPEVTARDVAGQSRAVPAQLEPSDGGESAAGPEWLPSSGAVQASHGIAAALARGVPARLACVRAGYRPTWWNPPEAERRRAAYFGIIEQIACEFGLPRRLLDALIAQESGFNAQAVSPAGAAGMMQIMPGTARSLGLSNPFDPIANLRAGAWYLRQQLERFGRYDLALAAYNAGPERRALQIGVIPAIPETQHYVRTILNNWQRLIKLEQPASGAASDRGAIAAQAVKASGYRGLELIRYD